MDKRKKWAEIFAGKTDPVAFFVALVAYVVTLNVLREFLKGFLERFMSWWVLTLLLAIPALVVALLLYYVLVSLRRKT